jgi:hypothetical protein
MKNIVSKFYVVAAFLCSTAIMFAQPGATSDDAPELGGMEGNDTQAPIGDYLWVLAVVGLVFVYFKFRSMQKNSIQG